MARAIFAVLAGVLIAIVVVPLATAASHVLGHLTLLELLFRLENLRAVFNSVVTALVAVLVSVPLALSLSWLVTRTDIYGARLLRQALIFPYFIPPFLFAIAWITLSAPEVGLLNRAFPILKLNLYSFWGLVWVFSVAYLPILVVSLCNALDRMDPALEEAARVSGAGVAKTFFFVTLPCLIPSLAGGALLFVLNVISAFGIPALIGGPGRIPLLTTRIYSAAKMGGLTGVAEGFVLAIWLVVFAGIIVTTGTWIQKGRHFRLVGGKVSRMSTNRLGRWQFLLSAWAIGVAVVLVVLPVFSTVLSSFVKVAGNFSALTLDNYRYLLQIPELGRALMNSFWMSGVTALLCCGIGFGISYFRDRTRLWGRHWVFQLATLGYSMPGTLIALSLIVSYGTGWGLEALALYGSPILLILAYICKYVAFSGQTLYPALANVDHALDDAARVFGANRGLVVRAILLPLMGRPLVTVFLMTAVPVVTELTMSVLLVGPGTETLGTVLFQLQEYANPLSACSLATLVMVGIVVLLPAMNRRICVEKTP